MKMYLKLLLTIGFCLLMVACKTAQLTSKKYEGRAISKERSDTLMERDTLMLFVHEKGDSVKIVQREIKWKNRTTILHDTLVVERTDTVRIVEPKIRSPSNTLSKVKSWFNTIQTAVVIIIVVIIILKIKQLWDRLI